MKQVLQLCFKTFLGCMLLASTPAMSANKSFTVAVVPQFSSTRTHRDWTPLLSHLVQITGYRFKLLAYNDILSFERDLKKGTPDLVYMNPYSMFSAKQKNGYIPLVRDTKPLSGILVVRQDSKLSKPSELNNQTIAFPSPNAFGASLYIRALLADQMHIKFKPVYTGSHGNVYRQVILGDAVAGGGVQKTLDQESDAVKAQLKVIYITPSVPPHPFAAHPRVPAAARKEITHALIYMRNNADTEKLLVAVHMPQPVEANFKRDYAGLAKLKLDHLKVTDSQ